jgi:hypothetical protein
MPNGGEHVYYQLSEWNGLIGPPSSLPPGPIFYPGGLPYNVGLWTYKLAAAGTANCQP